jgi:hypothetical protein
MEPRMERSADADGVVKEMHILQERLRALGILLRYETNPDNVRFYQRELDQVTEAHNDKANLLLHFSPTLQGKILSFPLKKPDRSA